MGSPLWSYPQNIVPMKDIYFQFELKWFSNAWLNEEWHGVSENNSQQGYWFKVLKEQMYYMQCWGKLLLKVMHYNIALLPKKVTITFLIYFLWKVMRYVTFALLSHYFFNMSRAWLFVFNTRSSIYSKCKSPFTPKSVMNPFTQAEGKVNSHLYSRMQKKKVQHSSAIKKQ